MKLVNVHTFILDQTDGQQPAAGALMKQGFYPEEGQPLRVRAAYDKATALT